MLQHPAPGLRVPAFPWSLGVVYPTSWHPCSIRPFRACWRLQKLPEELGNRAVVDEIEAREGAGSLP